MAVDHDAGERYAPWRGTYRATLRGDARGGSSLGARARRVGVVLLAAWVVVVAVGFAVRLVVALVRWDPLELLGVLLTPANAVLLLGLAWLRWPPQTALARSALSVRSALWRTRTVGWEDVVDVQPPGRFEEHPVALLASGERLPLVSLPVAVAEQMAAVTQSVPSVGSPPSTASPPSTGSPPSTESGLRPSDQEDLEGPFRRGRTAR